MDETDTDNNNKTEQSQTRVFLRIKRKRNELAVNSIFLEEGERSLKRLQYTEMLESLQSLTTNGASSKHKRKEEEAFTTHSSEVKPRLLFKRLNSARSPNTAPQINIEAAELNRNSRAKTQDASVTSVKRQTQELGLDLCKDEAFRVIDLCQWTEQKDENNVETIIVEAPKAPFNSRFPPQPPPRISSEPLTTKGTRILLPGERTLDEAIVAAFRTGQCAELVEALQTSGISVNFQRSLADHTTPLMAASYHGATAVVARLLSLGANPLMTDVHGNSAQDLAQSRGHRETVILLQQAVEAWPGSGKAISKAPNSLSGSQAIATHLKTDENFVYDYYYLDTQQWAQKSTRENSKEIPVVKLSGLTKTEGGELIFLDEDVSEAEDDHSTDSNVEGHFANDYPDEDTDSDGSFEEQRFRCYQTPFISSSPQGHSDYNVQDNFELQSHTQQLNPTVEPLSDRSIWQEFEDEHMVAFSEEENNSSIHSASEEWSDSDMIEGNLEDYCCKRESFDFQDDQI